MNEDVRDRIRAEMREDRERDLRQVIETKSGRRFLFSLMSASGTFEKTFTGSSQSYFNEGRRSIGLELFHEVMDMEPDKFVAMWKEDKQAAAERERRINEASED